MLGGGHAGSNYQIYSFVVDIEGVGTWTNLRKANNIYIFFFFSSRRRHTRFDCDWSSDVCSSDLDLPGGNRDREIPGGDQADRADRLARDLHAHARAYRGNDLARGAQRLAREKLEDLPGARGLAGRLRQRLALLAREQLAQLRAAREDLAAGEIERVETLLRRGDGPGRECRARRRDRGVHRGGIA